MKHFVFILACLCLLPAAALAQTGISSNLLKQWSLFGASNTTLLQPDGVAAVTLKAESEAGGINQMVVLDQIQPRAIRFSAECKAEGVSGEPAANNFSIYIDLTHPDGTKTYSVTAPFKTGSYDWQSFSGVHTPTKPIKSLLCYVLFRKKTGKAWFRNVALVQN
jgi:hypothetical protein